MEVSEEVCNRTKRPNVNKVNEEMLDNFASKVMLGYVRLG